jgi:hypothetical protein
MSETKSDHGTRSSHDTHGTHSGTPARANARAAAPRDAAADAQKLLLLLVADWLNNDRTHSAEIAALAAAMTAAAGPPVNVDVPYASLTGATASCTMGNWQGEPTSYAYAWHSDGVAIDGATSATYAVQPDDSGHSLACVVTATNALGSTVAPMSNAIAIA